MEDLVRVGIADAAERAAGRSARRLSVWSLRHRGARTCRDDPSGSHRGRPGPAPPSPPRPARDAARRAASSRLREYELTVGELERREREPSGRLRVAREPAQPARDHQVQHEEELAPRARGRCACRGAAGRGRACPRPTRSAEQPCAAGTDWQVECARSAARRRASRAPRCRPLCLGSSGTLPLPALSGSLLSARTRADMTSRATAPHGAPARLRVTAYQTLKRKCMTSPSCTTYSLPSTRILPTSFAPTSPLLAT